MNNGTISKMSTYCPLDLFSGKRERMKRAVKGLLDTPQNNLKIFKNGQIVYNDDSSFNDLNCVLQECFSNDVSLESNIDHFCDFVVTAVSRPFPSRKQFNTTPPCKTSIKIIPQTDSTRIKSHRETELIHNVRRILCCLREVSCHLKGNNIQLQ